MSGSSVPPDHLLREMLAHYESGYEAERLSSGTGQLERARTEEIIKRYLPPPPAVISMSGAERESIPCGLREKGTKLTSWMPCRCTSNRRGRLLVSNPIIRSPVSVWVMRVN